ncbi:MAG: peptidoglycan editing factor PgeF [Ammonifex sp.]|jgi:YfiH family protein|nr:MAG: peptidoglycan editing factor PgeF [Ammonifex sp.]
MAHAFSTRLGGVSEGAYTSLNLSFAVGDRPERVVENRRRLAGALGYDPQRMVCGRQVHGDKVAVVTLGEAGAGALGLQTALPATDGLITGTPGLPLVAYFADCVPVVFADPENRAIALAHAGWRGTLQEIARKALEKMTEAFGTHPPECLVSIGPAIGPCCYEVDHSVAARFTRWGPTVGAKKSGKWFVDLWEANRQILLGAGVRPERITVIKMCTACNRELMFSHRRDGGETGRMAAVVMLRSEGV